LSEIGRPAACGPLNTLVCEATPSAALPRRKIIALRLPKSPLFFLAPVHHKRLSPPEPSAELDAPVESNRAFSCPRPPHPSPSEPHLPPAPSSEPLRASSASGPLIRAPPSLICLRPPHLLSTGRSLRTPFGLRIDERRVDDKVVLEVFPARSCGGDEIYSRMSPRMRRASPRTEEARENSMSRRRSQRARRDSS
jgi:hypothetical protein